MDTSRERDASIERLLRHSLKAPRSAGATDSCLDAETLAAWADDGLSDAALEMAQSHVADCDRCQSLVGAMARTSSVVPQPTPERAARRWLAWLVPLTAAAAAIALWVAIPREANVTVTPATARPPSPSAEVLNEAKKDVAQPQAPRAAAPAETRESASKVERQAPAPVPELRKDAEQLEAVPPTAEQKETAAAPAAATPAAPPAAQAAPTAVAGRLSADTARFANGLAQTTCAPGWNAAPADVAAQLTAGAAPSTSVCWLVGRGGVVIVSIDEGRSWRRVMFPEITDLSAVRATGASAASITTADGRLFSTSDGGATWNRR